MNKAAALRALEEIARHEAGHAVAAVLFRLPFYYVTIEPDVVTKDDAREVRGAHIMYRTAPAIISDPRRKQWAITALAGSLAGARFAGRTRCGRIIGPGRT